MPGDKGEGKRAFWGRDGISGDLEAGVQRESGVEEGGTQDLQSPELSPRGRAGLVCWIPQAVDGVKQGQRDGRETPQPQR